jgi:hypothetical protein
MRKLIRLALSVFVGAAVCTLPAMGGQGTHGSVVGTVAQADRAHVDTATASAGADVYSCEMLETDEGGMLRVQVGSSQIYLGSLSATQLESEGSEVRAHVIRGMLSFSTPASSNFALETPAGILRAESGQSVTGQVAVTGPHEMVVTATHGSLLLDTWGEFRTIPEGQSAHIDFGSTIEVVCSNKGTASNQQQDPQRGLTSRKKLGFYLIMGTATVVPTYFIWQEMTESESKPQR